jgi:Holliday junction resolvase RusA-like endonuclease
MPARQRDHGGRAQIASICPIAAILGPQTLILTDFPPPEISRALSPNGRAHWATRRSARMEVESAVVVEGTVSRLRPVVGPLRVTFRYVFPTRRRRDIDNLTTGVTKAALDALVRGRWIEADDSEHVLSVTAEAVVEPGNRRLEITLAPAGRGVAGEGGA